MVRLLFVILAHNNPLDLAELASTLTKAGQDNRAIIHFDQNSSDSDFESLQKQLADNPRAEVVQNRVACKWGDFSLVQSVLNALAQERDAGREYDYTILLSGACLPCRPIQQLERYLEENDGMEFIEAQTADWIVAGLREDRYRLYFPFPPSPDPNKHAIMRAWVNAQRFLGIRRRPPNKLKIRFGSQWWCLTWGTCLKILETMENEPSVLSFFQKVYIPDEMVFNTLVANLVDTGKIAQFPLTHFQFNDSGKPVVFYDDHGDYPFSLNRFFYRKIGSEATQLRSESLKRALMDDDGSDLSQIGTPNYDYQIKSRIMTLGVAPGQMFFRDQLNDFHEGVLKFQSTPYIVICAPTSRIDNIKNHISGNEFEVFGRIFKNEVIEFGNVISTYKGLNEKDFNIRDLHQLLYVSRIRSRCEFIPVFFWSPGDKDFPIEKIIEDKHSLVISVPDSSADAGISELPGISDTKHGGRHHDYLLAVDPMYARIVSSLNWRPAGSVVTVLEGGIVHSDHSHLQDLHQSTFQKAITAAKEALNQSENTDAAR